MNVNKINSLNFDSLMRVLSSDKLSEAQKTRFVLHNKTQINEVLNVEISSKDFSFLMQKRDLVVFRPIKNIFTKKGDIAILAKALNISESEVPLYVKQAASVVNDVEKQGMFSADKIEILKTYVYRHGSKSALLSFFTYELNNAKDIAKTIFTTLSYNTGGVADYFERPIHRMSDIMLVKLFCVLDTRVKYLQSVGVISAEEATTLLQWAFVKFYELQNNSKIIGAIKRQKSNRCKN